MQARTREPGAFSPGWPSPFCRRRKRRALCARPDRSRVDRPAGPCRTGLDGPHRLGRATRGSELRRAGRAGGTWRPDRWRSSTAPSASIATPCSSRNSARVGRIVASRWRIWSASPTGAPANPKVIPREQIAGRLGPGPLLDALSTAAPERGRLTVVATEWSGYGSQPTYTTHRIAIPTSTCRTPRSPGQIPAGTPERAASAPRRAEAQADRLARQGSVRPPRARRAVCRDLHARLRPKARRRRHHRRAPQERRAVPHPAAPRSAQFEVVPNKLLCLVPEEFTWKRTPSCGWSPSRWGCRRTRGLCEAAEKPASVRA